MNHFECGGNPHLPSRWSAPAFLSPPPKNTVAVFRDVLMASRLFVDRFRRSSRTNGGEVDGRGKRRAADESDVNGMRQPWKKSRRRTVAASDLLPSFFFFFFTELSRNLLSPPPATPHPHRQRRGGVLVQTESPTAHQPSYPPKK